MTELELRPLFEEPALLKEVPREPTRVIVSLSGGKDSVASLILALELFGPELVVGHHQVVLEDFVGTVEYCRSACHFLGVPLSLSQGVYNSFLCLGCGRKHLSLFFEEAYCHTCGSRDKQFLGAVRGIHDYIRHRGKWMGGTVRPCTKNFKIEVWNAWARENVSLHSYCASAHTYCANLCKGVALIITLECTFTCGISNL